MNSLSSTRPASFYTGAAANSFYCPFVAVLLSGLCFLVVSRIGSPFWMIAVAGVIGLVSLLFLVGLICGVVALFGIPEFGAKGILGKALFGVLFPLPFVLSAPIVIFALGSSFVMEIAPERDTRDEAKFQQLIVGSWKYAPSNLSTFKTISTFDRGGRGTETIILPASSKLGEIKMEIEWSVSGRLLVAEVISSSAPERFPVGLVLKDRIIAMSEDQLLVESFEGYGAENGIRATLNRVK